MTTSVELLKKWKKDFGDNIATIGEQAWVDIPRLPTGVFPVDLATGGGFPMGKCSIIYGPESCLDADTFIQYEVKNAGGKRQNHKGGTIEHLYLRFNGLPRSGKGAYQRPSTVDSIYTAPCLNEEGRIFHNRIVGVVQAGVKPCLEVITESGLRIVATADHKFHVGHGFVCLGELAVGDSVLIHNNTPYTGTSKTVVEGYRRVIYVKHHPNAQIQNSGGYEYRRLVVARAKVEASLNGLSLDDYRDRLNAGDLEGLTFLTGDQHVHHQDEDYTNDDLSNLEVLTPTEHGRAHALERHNNLRYMAVEDVIASIVQVGDRMTYDIQMASPHNNFVADGFVVHNSNKTNLLYGAIREGQKMYPDKKAAIIDAEHEVNIPWAKQLGVDPERLIVLHPDYAEQAVDMVESLIYAQDIFCVGLDSIAALTKQSEVENSAEKSSYGGASILVGRMYRKAVVGFSKMHREGVQAPAFIAINQIRMKMDAGPHGNPETMPGGNAQRFAASMILRTYGKNVMDSKLHKVLPAFKECNVIVKKWKVPILSMNAEYKMQMIAAGGNPAGFVADWNTIAAYMKELDYLSKAGEKPGSGWIMAGDHYPTLEACKEALYGDVDQLQGMRAAIISELLDAGTGAEAVESEGDKDLDVELEE